MIGVRIGRNSPVLFVTGDCVAREPGDRVIVALDDMASEQEASVVVSADQLLKKADIAPVGRVLRSA